MEMKYGSIQMMRGIAALTVVAMHIGIFGKGLFGVDLFFCISGFIMMHVTDKSTHQFLEKRAIRVIPLYWIVTIALSIIIIVNSNFSRSLTVTPEIFIKSILFIPVNHSPEFPQFALIGVGWSLIMEVYFYFIFFIAMQIAPKHRHYIVTGIFIIMAIIGLTVKSDNLFVRFYCTPIMLEFSLGMFSWKLLTRPGSKKWNSLTAFIATSVAALIWAGLFMIENTPKHLSFFGAERTIIYGFPAFIFFLLIFKGLEGRLVPHHWIVLGNISYSLYLTHFYVLSFFRRLYDIDNYSSMGLVLVLTVIFPTIIITAYASWWLIENKLTEWIKEIVAYFRTFLLRPLHKSKDAVLVETTDKR